MTNKILMQSNILKQFQRFFSHDFNSLLYFKILLLKFVKIFFFFVDSFLLHNYKRFFAITISIDINRNFVNFDETS